MGGVGNGEEEGEDRSECGDGGDVANGVIEADLGDKEFGHHGVDKAGCMERMRVRRRVLV